MAINVNDVVRTLTVNDSLPMNQIGTVVAVSEMGVRVSFEYGSAAHPVYVRRTYRPTDLVVLDAASGRVKA